MTNEQLNTSLYKKMFAEQENFKNWLLSLPSAEILNHTYEYTVREDILYCLEENNLDDKQVKALLRSPCPLADVFKEWENRETGYMDEILETVKSRADKAKEMLTWRAKKQLER